MHLSKTNPTLINGKPVGKEWYLQDGDEIQLSYEGPKIVFIIPLNNNTGTLGLSHRMTLFRQQALRPYKTTILILSMVLVIAVASLVYWNFENEKTWKNKFDQTTYEMDSLREALVKESKRVIMLNEENLSLKESSDREINYLKKWIKERIAWLDEKLDYVDERTGIKMIHHPVKSNIIGYYNLQGIPLYKQKKGITIIKYDDGTSNIFFNK